MLKEVETMKKNEKRPDKKQVSITYVGYEKAKAEALGMLGIKSSRLGLKTAIENHYSKEEIELLTEIIYTEDKINALEIDLKMAKKHLESLNSSYKEINKYSLIKKDIILFMDNLIKKSIEENPEITDLTEIYKLNFNAIDIKAMEHNLRYKNAIEIYEEYRSIKEAEEEANKLLSAKQIQKE